MLVICLRISGGTLILKQYVTSGCATSFISSASCCFSLESRSCIKKCSLTICNHPKYKLYLPEESEKSKLLQYNVMITAHIQAHCIVYCMCWISLQLLWGFSSHRGLYEQKREVLAEKEDNKTTDATQLIRWYWSMGSNTNNTIDPLWQFALIQKKTGTKIKIVDKGSNYS